MSHNPLPTLCDTVTITAMLCDEHRIIELADKILANPEAGDYDELQIEELKNSRDAVELAGFLANLHHSTGIDAPAHDAAVQIKCHHLLLIDSWLYAMTGTDGQS